MMRLIGPLLRILAALWVCRAGRQSAALDAAEAYAATRGRMDDVEMDDDPAVLRDWLRARDPLKR